MALRRLAQLGMVAVLASSALGGPTASGPAQAAGRAGSSCYQTHVLSYYPYATPPYVVGEHLLNCPPVHGSLPVTIYKDESGSWVAVASGSGLAFYYCNGSVMNAYKDNSGDQITAPCT